MNERPSLEGKMKKEKKEKKGENGGKRQKKILKDEKKMVKKAGKYVYRHPQIKYKFIF